jgi:hypothetical protein
VNQQLETKNTNLKPDPNLKERTGEANKINLKPETKKPETKKPET